MEKKRGKGEGCTREEEREEERRKEKEKRREGGRRKGEEKREEKRGVERDWRVHSPIIYQTATPSGCKLHLCFKFINVPLNTF